MLVQPRAHLLGGGRCLTHEVSLELLQEARHLLSIVRRGLELQANDRLLLAARPVELQ